VINLDIWTFLKGTILERVREMSPRNAVKEEIKPSSELVEGALKASEERYRRLS
jgi:hypothetical protein